MPSSWARCLTGYMNDTVLQPLVRRQELATNLADVESGVTDRAEHDRLQSGFDLELFKAW